MNEVDWLHREDTTVANAMITSDKLATTEHNYKIRLMDEIRILSEENEKLRAENAELRKQCMTNFDRLKEATIDEATDMIFKAVGVHVPTLQRSKILKWLTSRDAQ